MMDRLEMNMKNLAEVGLFALIGAGLGLLSIVGITFWLWIETGHWFLPGMPPYIP